MIKEKHKEGKKAKQKERKGNKNNFNGIVLLERLILEFLEFKMQVIQQDFERLNIELGGIRDQMDIFETNLQKWNLKGV